MQIALTPVIFYIFYIEGKLKPQEKEKQIPSYLETTFPGTTTDDIDWFVYKEFMGKLKLPLPLQKYLEPDVQFHGDVCSLVTHLPGGSQHHAPRNFALLLFGKEPYRFFSGAKTIFSVYYGKDKLAERIQRYEVFGPIPLMINNIMDKLLLYMGSEIKRNGEMLKGKQKRKRFSVDAVREAIVNAFVHRDYLSHEPVRSYRFQ